jgi:hypothetical protein
MKIFLMTCVATLALAGAAVAADVGTATSDTAPFNSLTSVTNAANELAVKPVSSTKPAMDTNAMATMGAKPAGTSPATAPSGEIVGAATAAGSDTSVWKVGQDSYAFEGSVNGCHFNGGGGPSGSHINNPC